MSQNPTASIQQILADLAEAVDRLPEEYRAPVAAQLERLRAALTPPQAPKPHPPAPPPAPGRSGEAPAPAQGVYEMPPPNVIQYGLSRAIQVHSEGVRAKYPNLQLDLDLIEDEGLLPEEVCLALYRIYQESLSNIVRHARAGKVWVRYYPSRQHMVLEIKDDGSGFSIPADWAEFSEHDQFGLGVMKERAEMVGGRLEVSSNPGQGTLVRASVPLSLSFRHG